MKSGVFIIIDGIDGSGKSTVVKAMQTWVEAQGKKTFDFVAACKEYGSHPSFADAEHADVLFTSEPTYAWVGAALRKEMFQTPSPYSPLEFAHTFALDRMLLYRRLIIPALVAGKTVIQDRSVSTSLVYQADAPNGPSLDTILALPGNQLALAHAPDHLILLNVQPKVALARIASRNGKAQDVFETLEQQERFHERFHSQWFANIFTERGTTIHSLDAANGLDASIENTHRLISQILS